MGIVVVVGTLKNILESSLLHISPDEEEIARQMSKKSRSTYPGEFQLNHSANVFMRVKRNFCQVDGYGKRVI
jgi:hypothetical protein